MTSRSHGLLPFSILAQLKFLIIMPAWALFTQILRRFGDEALPNKSQAFEDDPIVKYLGGANKVRSLRDRWQKAWTVTKSGTRTATAVQMEMSTEQVTEQVTEELIPTPTRSY